MFVQESNRKKVEQRIEDKVNTIQREHAQISFRLDNTEQINRKMEDHTSKALEEIEKMNAQIRSNGEHFIKELDTVNETLNN